MASCAKCGKMKLRRHKDGLRKCPRCGALGGNRRLGRSGTVTTLFTCTATTQQEATK